MSIEILSVNVRGIGSQKKRREIFYWLHKKKGDIFFIQETHSTSKDEQIWSAEWGGKVFFSHGTSESRGTAVLISNSFNGKITEVEIDQDGRYIILSVQVDDIVYILLNIYAPNRDSPVFFSELFEKVKQMENDYVIVGGDMNITLNPDIDKKTERTTSESHSYSRDTILQYMEDQDMVDVWRLWHQDGRKYTWSRSRPYPIMSRIDYFLISYGLCNHITDSYIKPGYKTDHSLIGLRIQSGVNTRGPGFWKLNCKYLENQEYVQIIRQCIKETVERTQQEEGARCNDHLIWEMIKMNVRGETIKFTARKKKAEQNLIKLLEHKIDLIEGDTSIEAGAKEHRKRELREELNKIVEDKTKGAMIRTKMKWMEEGEKPSKYFLGLEKRNYNNKAISRLQKSDGTFVTKLKDIQDEQYNYYSKLYTSVNIPQQDIDEHEFFQNVTYPKLTNEAKERCEGIITENEVYSALKTCKNNRTPGTDGLPAEFYLTFWNDIKKYLLHSIHKTYEEGTLTTSQKQGIITLLPKKDRINTLLKNWRPLTLLNQDYKLAAKVIANRIKGVLEDIIHNDQTGFIKIHWRKHK